MKEFYVRIILFSAALISHASTLQMKKIPINSITAVSGGSASLPCNTSHPKGDAILLLLWFKGDISTPIYRYDVRPIQSSSKHWMDDALSAKMDVENVPEKFVLKNLTPNDESFYRCRVDFKKQPTKTTRTYLAVVVPPTNVTIYQGHNFNQGVNNVVGPYREGDTLSLTCVSKGGRPPPRVVWFEDTRLLDKIMESVAIDNIADIKTEILNSTRQPFNNSMEETLVSDNRNPAGDPFEGNPFNTLILGPLSRKHLKMLLTCESSNNNITLPTSLVVMVDLILPPLSIELIAPKQPFLAKNYYNLDCITFGGLPSPTITWWLNDRELTTSISSKSSRDGNITTSSLGITMDSHHDKQIIQCMVNSDITRTLLQENLNLTVHYVPHATVKFGASLNSKNIKEGDDVYFECVIDANPRTIRVTWRQNNELLYHNVTAGVIVSNQSLVLQKVHRAQAGLYTCHSFNILGDGASKPLKLNVKYSPVCAANQVTTYAVSRQEDAEVTCTADANPPEATFQWTFNNTADTIEVPHGRYTTAKHRSVITYTPVTSLDYGTLLCWASNEIGTQEEPCLFHIVPAGKPDPPSNCTISRLLRTSLLVICLPGNNGGFEQVFHLKASVDGNQLINLTTTTPEFKIDSLSPGKRYRLEITAENERGSSFPFHLSAKMRSLQNSLFDDGPSEAEVRDSSNTANGMVETPSSSVPASSSPAIFHSYFEPISLESFLPLATGIGAGLLLVIVVLLILIIMRAKSPFKRYHRSQSRQAMLNGRDKDSVETPTDIPLTTTDIINEETLRDDRNSSLQCQFEEITYIPSISDLINSNKEPVYKWANEQKQELNAKRCGNINCKAFTMSTKIPPRLLKSSLLSGEDSKPGNAVSFTLPRSSYRKPFPADGNIPVASMIQPTYIGCDCEDVETNHLKDIHGSAHSILTGENYL